MRVVKIKMGLLCGDLDLDGCGGCWAGRRHGQNNLREETAFVVKPSQFIEQTLERSICEQI